MQIVRNLRYIPDLSLALGFFDGVHLGHRAVITSAVEYAATHNLESAVVTFSQHPFCYLNGICPSYITLRSDSYNAIRDLGIDYIIELDFDKISKMTSECYLEDILYKYFKPKAISTGFNHHFGSDCIGNCAFLENNKEKYGRIK